MNVSGFHVRLCAVALCVCALGACGESRRVSDDARTLRVGNGDEPRSLDPQVVTGIVEERLLSALFEGLVNVDFETMQPTPGVAESWTVSEDGTRYVFTIRDDARWSNGARFTADDVVASWRRMLHPDLGAEYAYMLYPIAGAEAYHTGQTTDPGTIQVHARDERLLEVRLRAPTPYFLTMQIHFAYYPVPVETIRRFGGEFERDTAWVRPEHFVSNGPFRLAAWSPNREIVVERNPEYWGADSVGMDRIVYKPIAQAATEERAFRAGELDITYRLPLAKIAAYRESNPEALRVEPYLGTEFLRFNVTRPPFDDPRVRHAFSLAIDRREVAQVMRGGQQPASSFVPPATGGYTFDGLDADANWLAFDPARAARLLAEAGYGPDTPFPTPRMLYNANENSRLYCETIQRMWEEHLGVRVELENTDTKTWLARMMIKDYDIVRSFWVGDYVDASNFLEMFLSGSGNNRTGYSNPVYDGLISEASLAVNDAARFALYQQAERMLLDDTPIAPVFHLTLVYLARPAIEGLTPNLLGRIDWKKLKRPVASPAP